MAGPTRLREPVPRRLGDLETGVAQQWLSKVLRGWGGTQHSVHPIQRAAQGVCGTQGMWLGSLAPDHSEV